MPAAANPSEVLILGGGPAAVAAAITCRRAGLATRLVTKDHAPDPHPRAARGACSRVLESMHPGVEVLLEQLGARKALQAAGVATYESIVTGGVESRLSPEESQTWHGTHVRRSMFDRALLDCARACGVDVLLGSRVVGMVTEGQRVAGARTSDGAALRARWTIDATGRRGTLGKLLGCERWLMSPPLTAWTGVGPSSAWPGGVGSPSFIPEPHGWTWLTQAIDDEVTWTRLTPTRARPPSALPDHSARLGEVVRASNVQWRVFRPLVRPGALLAGDAGGVLDPACGQGVLNALYSGIVAASSVVQSANDGLGESWYMAAYDQWFMERFETMAGALRAWYDKLGIRILSGEPP